MSPGRAQKPAPIQTNFANADGEAAKASSSRPGNQVIASPAHLENQSKSEFANDNGNTQTETFRVPSALNSLSNVQAAANLQVPAGINRLQGGPPSETMGIRQQVRTPSAYITRAPSVPHNLAVSEQRLQDGGTQWASVQVQLQNAPSTGKVSPD